MPIYEFYCSDCHRIFNFFSRGVNTSKRPACPRCGRPELERRTSAFAISRGRERETDDGLPPDVDPSRLEAAFESLEREASSLDQDDPRQAARLMRRLYDAAGLELGPSGEEALSRMEAGEDPEAIEQEYGDALEEDIQVARQPGAGTLSRLRRALPARVDPGLYDL